MWIIKTNPLDGDIMAFSGSMNVTFRKPKVHWHIFGTEPAIVKTDISAAGQ